MAITPLHFTTDKLFANHNPLFPNFLKWLAYPELNCCHESIFRMKQESVNRQGAVSSCLPLYFYYHNSRGQKPNLFFKIKIFFVFLDHISPVWRMRAITPSRFTTDKRNARVNPSPKKFLKERYGCSSSLKRIGAWRTLCCPVKTFQLLSHSPIAEFF